MNSLVPLQKIFQVLGDLNRLRIVLFIGNKTCSVSEIVQATGLSQPLVSHHLRALKEMMVLQTKREGPFIFYQLKDRRLLEAVDLFKEIVRKF